MKTILTQNFSSRLVSSLLLLTLHAAIIADINTPLARSLIIAHLGIFLLWQPIWRSDQRLNWPNTLLFLVLTSAFIVWLDWWLITGWLILLIGLTGGRLPQTRQDRNCNIVILFFLFIELLISCASQLFAIRLDPALINFFDAGLFLLPLLLLVIPGRPSDIEKKELQVDLFSAITTALLASLLLLGSLINSHPLVDQDYITALIKTFLFIGALILLISWLLSPRKGFSGLAELWTQSLLNIGTPFENWVSEIAKLKSSTDTPEAFIGQASRKLLALPMIEGVSWQTTGLDGSDGNQGRNPVHISSENIEVTIFTSRRIGATLLLHFRLLVQIIDHFYTAKLQERELSRQAHMQAIYETGARITHDIKNILQSFHNITSVISSESSRKSEATLSLLRKQLPILTQRLELALSKLQHTDAETINYIDARQWWQDTRNRFSDLNILFREHIAENRQLPRELLDSLMENLIENINQKRELQGDITIQIILTVDSEHTQLVIRDSGMPIPEDKAARLFRQPLHSDTGLGVGLLQLAELAKELGYELYLAYNEPGRVEFRLEKTGC